MRGSGASHLRCSRHSCEHLSKEVLWLFCRGLGSQIAGCEKLKPNINIVLGAHQKPKFVVECIYSDLV